jgi:hypothetical protein
VKKEEEQMPSNHFDLEKELEIIWNKMLQENLIPENMKDRKNEILENLAQTINEQIDGELSVDNLRNPNVQKLLMGSIISELLGLKQNTAEFIKTIDKVRDNPEPNAEIDSQLKKEFDLLKSLTQLLKMKKENKLPKLEPGQKNLKDKLQEELQKTQSTEEKNAKEKNITEGISLLEQTLRNLNGGDNPNIAGEVPFPVLGPVLGNLLAVTNQTSEDPNSCSYMVESITYNIGKEDPLGLEQMASLADMTVGISDEISRQSSPSFKPHHV